MLRALARPPGRRHQRAWVGHRLRPGRRHRNDLLQAHLDRQRLHVCYCGGGGGEETKDDAIGANVIGVSRPMDRPRRASMHGPRLRSPAAPACRTDAREASKVRSAGTCWRKLRTMSRIWRRMCSCMPDRVVPGGTGGAPSLPPSSAGSASLEAMSAELNPVIALAPVPALAPGRRPSAASEAARCASGE